jgi:membrane protein involved in colicin uptake
MQNIKQPEVMWAPGPEDDAVEEVAVVHDGQLRHHLLVAELDKKNRVYAWEVRYGVNSEDDTEIRKEEGDDSKSVGGAKIRCVETLNRIRREQDKERREAEARKAQEAKDKADQDREAAQKATEALANAQAKADGEAASAESARLQAQDG